MWSFVRAQRNRVLGILGLALVILVIFLSGATYARLFTPVVMATVLADRAGLLLDPKSDVTLRGVTVGEVRDIELEDRGVRISVALDPALVDQVPGNVTAAIDAPTVFGAKFIDLRVPPVPGPPVEEGGVIQAVRNTTEVNEVFDNLMSLLSSVDPAELNVTLGAISTALQGRGDQVGQYLSQLNDYLVRFNPQLPVLQEDLRRGADVAGIYARAAPDIRRILSNTTVLARTLQEKEAGLDALFRSFGRLGTDGTSFLRAVRPSLRSATSALRPTTALVAEYSPTYPCLLGQVRRTGQSLDFAAGYGKLPGLSLLVSVLPPQPGYRHPADLPRVAARDAPSCRGFPLRFNGANPPFPYTGIDDGVTTVDFTRQNGVSVTSPAQLAESLFGDRILPLLGTPAASSTRGGDR